VLTALILICSATVAPDVGECTRSNATTVMRVPAEFGNPSTCFMHAQAYLAGTSFGQDLGPNDRVKIICVRSETIAASRSVNDKPRYLCCALRREEY
jgi:hypothetical protein